MLESIATNMQQYGIMIEYIDICKNDQERNAYGRLYI